MLRTGFLSVVFIVLSLIGYGAEVNVTMIQGRKGRQIKLTNEFLCLLIDPQEGGAIKSFLFQGKELTRKDGVLNDHLWDQRLRGDWWEKPYLYKVKSGTGSVTVHLQAMGESGTFQFLEINKYITVCSDRSDIQVRYVYRNCPNSCGPITLKAWYHFILGPKGGRTYYTPTAEGVKTSDFVVGGKIHDVWYQSPARGWSAVACKKSKVGVVCIPDYRYIQCYYNWFGPYLSTLEWRFIPVVIECGKTFETKFTIHPFVGLDHVDGAGTGVVGALRLMNNGKAGVLELISSLEQKLTCSVSAGGKKLVNSVNAGFAPGEKKEITFDAASVPEGSVLRAVIERDGKLIADLHCRKGKPSQRNDYVLRPLQKQVVYREKEIPWRFSLSRTEKPDPIIVAKPSVFRPAKAYFIQDTATLRDIIELESRVDIQGSYATVPVSYALSWIPAEGRIVGGTQLVQLVREKGMKSIVGELERIKPDVIIVGRHYISKYCSRKFFTWGMLSKEVRAHIVERVKNGTGLVIIWPDGVKNKDLAKAIKEAEQTDGSRYITAGFPFTLLKQVKPDAVRTATLGKGRVVVLDYKADGVTPYTHPYSYNFAYEEFYFSLVGRALLWASGRQAECRIVKAQADQRSIQLGLKGNMEKCAGYRMTLWNGRSREGNVCKVIKPDGNSLSIPVPQDLTNGRHFATIAILDGNKRALDWTTVLLNVQRAFIIKELRLASDTVKIGEAFNVQVSMDGAVPANSADLTLTCHDNLGRLIFRERKKVVVPEGISFTFTIKNPLTLVHVIDASLSVNNKIVSKKSKTLYVPEIYAAKPMFSLAIWGGYVHGLLYCYTDVLRRVKEIGFDTLNEGTTWELAENVKPTVYSNLRVKLCQLNRMLVPHPVYLDTNRAYARTRDKHVLVRKGCLSDPAYRKRVIEERILPCVRDTMKYGTIGYMLGDEMSLTTEGGNTEFDICFSKHCLKKFHAWLQKKFTTIEQLNKAWLTDYTSFASIMPLTVDEARKDRKFASWIAHRSFMDTVYADAFRWHAEAIRSVNPGAFVGESGIQPKISAYGGYDWSKRMKYERHANFYGRGDIPLSFINRHLGFFGSWCLGYSKNEPQSQRNIWQALFHGQNMISYWYSPFLVNPDLTLSSYGRFIMPYLHEVKNGPGHMLSAADYVYDPIAIHYSQRSCQMACLLKDDTVVNTYRAFCENITSLNRNIRAWGYTPRFVSSGQIENNELLLKKYQVLFLPFSLCISDKEADAIREFVRKGGTVIADVATGLYTEWGVPREKGVLDELFGLERGNSMLQLANTSFAFKGRLLKAKIVEGNVVRRAPIFAPAQKTEAETFGSIKLRRSQPKVIGGFSRNDFGKGAAVYLGCLRLDTDYGRGNLLADLLSECGLEPYLKLTNAQGEKSSFEGGHFRDGDHEYFGVIVYDAATRQKRIKESMAAIRNRSMSLTVAFPVKGHIYEVRSHKYLGYGNTARDTFHPAVARLYAVLPAKPGVTISAGEALQGKTLQCRITATLNGRHVLHREVFSPKGQKIDCLSKVVFATNNGFDDSIPFALNDPCGIWTISYTDVITGRKIQTQVKLQKGD